MSTQNISLTPIGKVNSPYKQKFVIPRQANLANAATGIIELNKEFTDFDCLRGIDQFTHLWIIYFLHETASLGWTPTVQPPRLGGKKKVGVFSSRAAFRPNPIGISAVKYIEHFKKNGSICIKISGMDLLDGTPVLDIKPYIPYADSIPSADGGYASEKPQQGLSVEFSDDAEKKLITLETKRENLRSLIEQVLSLDPRPAWEINTPGQKQYGATLFDINIKFHVHEETVLVKELHQLQQDS